MSIPSQFWRVIIYKSVGHAFGAQSNDMGGSLVRSVGLAPVPARIGLSLAYSMRRLAQLERLPAVGVSLPEGKFAGIPL